MHELIRNLLQQLNSLGDSAQIANFLLEHKCFGRCGKCKDCPVALYLKRKGCSSSLSLDEQFITWLDNILILQQMIVPMNVCCFIVDFDTKKFPKLDSDLQPCNYD